MSYTVQAASRPIPDAVGNGGPAPSSKQIAASRRQPVRRIAILSHIGLQNLGDDLLVASVVAYVRKRVPNVQLVAFTLAPEDTRQRHGLEAYPVRPHARPQPNWKAGGATQRKSLLVRVWNRLRETVADQWRELRFSVQSARRLRGSDLVIVAGSSQFIDAYGGYWGFPRTLLRWTLLARLLRARICFLSMGAEPLNMRRSKWAIRATIGLANYVSVRDPVSAQRLERDGVRRSLPLVPDLALGYSPPLLRPAARGKVRTLGINAIPYYHHAYWREGDDLRYRRYIDAMTSFAASVLEQGHRIVLYGTTEWADGMATRDIAERLARSVDAEAMSRVTRPAVNSLDSLWRLIAGLDWVVAARYHGVVTALLMKKPVIALAYETKTIDVMRMMDVGRFATDLPAATAAWLSSCFGELQQEEDLVVQSIESGVYRAREQVQRQFETVLNGIAPARLEAL